MNHELDPTLDIAATMAAQLEYGPSAQVSRALDLDGRHLDDGTPAEREPWFPGTTRPLAFLPNDGIGHTAGDADEVDPIEGLQ